MNKLSQGILIIQFVIVAFSLQGCDRSQPPESEEEVLAIVNNTLITKQDLELSLEKVLGRRASFAVTEGVEKKALKSLVMMRVISMQQEKLLDEQEVALFKRKARHYHEELLVEAYLRGNTEISVPTEMDVKDYYQRHLQSFTSEPVYTFEILQASQAPKTEGLASILQELSIAKQKHDWSLYAEELKRKKQRILYINGRTDGPAMDARLISVLERLTTNQVSDVVYLDKTPRVIKLLERQEGKSKPLHEVRSDIRKILATQHIKNSIKQVSEEILSSADVEYK